MKISGQREQEKLILRIEGRLDTATSPQLEQELGEGFTITGFMDILHVE